jgi:hypothetical protein
VGFGLGRLAGAGRLAVTGNAIPIIGAECGVWFGYLFGSGCSVAIGLHPVFWRCGGGGFWVDGRWRVGWAVPGWVPSR